MVFIIADDLTGACDSGIQYRKNGWNTVTQVEYDADTLTDLASRYDTVSINADSRVLLPDDAYKLNARIARQAAELPCEYIYKKIDSIMRGNPAEELDAVIDASGASCCLIAPSYPKNGRIMEQGIIYFGENKIDAFAMFKSKMHRRVELIPIEVIRQGRKAVESIMLEKEKENIQVFLADASTEEELMMLAEIGLAQCPDIVLCGSAGYADSLSVLGSPMRQPLLLEQNESATAMVVIGSRNAETAAQVIRMRDTKDAALLSLSAEDILAGQDLHTEMLASQAERYFEEGNRVVMLTLNTLFQQSEKRLNGVYDKDETNVKQAMLLVQALGQTVQAVTDKVKIDVMFASGGDTAREVCRAVGLRELIPLREAESGVPVCLSKLPNGEPIAVVTKSGGFGTNDTLVNIMGQMGCL